MDSLLAMKSLPPVRLQEAPDLEEDFSAAYQEKLDLLTEDPHLFNGMCTVATTISPELIEAYSVDYARGVLYEETEGRFLSVGCQLFDPQGMMLWARRGVHVAEHPDCWEPGVSGTMDQVSDPEQMILMELAEELGVEPELHFLGVSQGQKNCQLTWIGLVETDAPAAHPPEVTAVQWLPEGEFPEGELTPIGKDLITTYFEAYRLLRA